MLKNDNNPENLQEASKNTITEGQNEPGKTEINPKTRKRDWEENETTLETNLEQN